MKKSSDTFDLGSVTIFVNVPKECHNSLSDADVHYIEAQVIEQFWAGKDEFGVDDNLVKISHVHTKPGCLLCTIGFCAIPGAIKIAGGVGTFIIAYPKLCDGLRKMAEHVGWVRFKHHELTEARKQRTALYKDELKTEQEVAALLKDLQRTRKKANKR